MATLGWVALGVVAWLLVATAVALVIGRTIRLRDTSLPDPRCEAPPREPDRRADGASPTHCC